MKKIFLISSILFIFSTLVKGKIPIDSNKFNFNISFGVAIPFKNLHANNSQLISKSDSSAYGTAETGIHFDISADWYFFRHFGIAALYGESINPFNTEAYNNSINFDVPTSTSANDFYLREYLLGFVYRTNISSKIIMNCKVMIGDIAANFPNVTISFPATSNQPAGTNVWTIQSSNAFVWCFNAGIKFALYKHLYFTGDISYSMATVKYPYYILSQTLQGSSTLTISNPTSVYMTIGLLKPTVGVDYCF